MIRGGRSYISSPPSLSNDSKKLLVYTGNTVSGFSAVTGLQITAWISSSMISPYSSDPAIKKREKEKKALEK
ncbi:unnamed protein product [Cochlearia groenlandica]